MEALSHCKPISNEYVTVVMVINSIHHWNDIITGLSEVQRVLKTHGRFFVADELKSDGTTHGKGKLSDPQNIVRLLSESGFTDIEQTQYKHGKEEMVFFPREKSNFLSYKVIEENIFLFN